MSSVDVCVGAKCADCLSLITAPHTHSTQIPLYCLCTHWLDAHPIMSDNNKNPTSVRPWPVIVRACAQSGSHQPIIMSHPTSFPVMKPPNASYPAGPTPPLAYDIKYPGQACCPQNDASASLITLCPRIQKSYGSFLFP